jgi:hypothetical protein
MISQAVLSHGLEIALGPGVGDRVIATAETHNASVAQAHQMIDRDATALDIVVADHVHPGNSNVVPRDCHGGDFTGNLAKHLLGEAVGDEYQSLDLKLLKGVDFCPLQSWVISPADQHCGEPVLPHLGLNTIEDLGENRVVKIEHEDAEGATLFGRQTPRCGVGSIAQLRSGAFDTLPAGITDFV